MEKYVKFLSLMEKFHDQKILIPYGKYYSDYVWSSVFMCLALVLDFKLRSCIFQVSAV